MSSLFFFIEIHSTYQLHQFNRINYRASFLEGAGGRGKEEQGPTKKKNCHDVPPMDDQMYGIAQCLLEKRPISQ